MKENKKAILDLLSKNPKKAGKDAKFETLVLNLALQKIDSDSFEFDGEAVYTADKTRLVYCMSTAETFAIPEGVEVIGEMAFRGKKHLKTVIIPSSVREIDQDAFYDCDELDNVYIPESVKEVKAYAFAECDKLKKITFAAMPKHLSRHTFDDCDQLHNIFVPAGSSKTFRKALHFLDGDTDLIVVEKSAEEKEPTQDQPKPDKKKDDKKGKKDDKKKRKAEKAEAAEMPENPASHSLTSTTPEASTTTDQQPSQA